MTSKKSPPVAPGQSEDQNLAPGDSPALDQTSAGDDDWAAAMAEQTAAAPAEAEHADAGATPTTGVTPAAGVFKSLGSQTTAVSNDIDMVMDIPVRLAVELGCTRLTIKNLLQLSQGSVVALDGLAGEPMDIYVNGYLIAQGEVVVVDEKYGIRLTDIITPSERLNRLNNRR